MVIKRYPSNWRPNRVIISEKENRTDIYYGKKGDKNHGHTVIKDNDVKYARTAENRVLVDKKSPKDEKSVRGKLEKFVKRRKKQNKDISGR